MHQTLKRNMVYINQSQGGSGESVNFSECTYGGLTDERQEELCTALICEAGLHRPSNSEITVCVPELRSKQTYYG